MALTNTQPSAEDWVPTDTFGARLALIRQANGWNVKEAAEACGLDDQSWRNWEAGRKPRRMDEIALQIARATRCDYVWLLAGGPLKDITQMRCFPRLAGGQESFRNPDGSAWGLDPSPPLGRLELVGASD